MKKPLFKRKAFLFSLFPLLLILGYVLFFRGSEGQINVLIYSNTQQFRHSSIEPGIDAIRALGKQEGFYVEATENPDSFAEGYLQRFNVLIFLNTSGDVLDEGQQIELRRFIQAGGGFVGVHAAADTEYEWPWYNELVGAWFESHPMNPNVREGRLLIADADHPATRHLPEEWIVTDEWYEYKDFRAETVQVLINIDETSYKSEFEFPQPEPRPIAWHHDFEGGRSFYTGLGHTDESYSDPNFVEHLWGGILYAAGDQAPVNYDNATVAPDQNRFIQSVYATDLDEPMEVDLLPDGRILFVERPGDFHVYDPTTSQLSTIATLDVHTGHEDGLLGLAVDPNYSSNNWIYLFYSPAGEEAKQHVSRFNLVDNQLDLSSEKVLLSFPTQRDECCHSAGSMEFGPNGNLFITTGDNTLPHASEGYTPIDERPGREPMDAQRTSGNTNDLRGKILRIKPEPDGSYSIPEGNLFEGDDFHRPEIYTMGHRNPYRIAIDPETGWLYWGDIGPDAGSAREDRGPAAFDEFNQAKRAGNFGWPYFVGDNQAYIDFDFETGISGSAFDPAHPVNDSPNNTGARELPPAQPAMVWYAAGESEAFPVLRSGGRSAMAGFVYHSDAPGITDEGLPEYYDDKVFFIEWMRGMLLAVTLDENGQYSRMEQFLPDFHFNNVIDIKLAPDGSLYILEYGPIWFSGSPEAQLSRIQYVKGNRRPVATIASNATVGGLPFEAEFSAIETQDPDGDSLTYQWAIDGELVSQEAILRHTFSEAGSYQLKLTVSDPSGETSSTEQAILAGNALPQLDLAVDGNTQYYWPDQPIQYVITGSDAEDGIIGDEIDSDEIIVTFDYLPQGEDLVMPALSHQDLLESTRFLLGKRLVEKGTCMACHQTDTPSVGPSFQDISEKYAETDDAAGTLAGKVIQGGVGIWGETAMPAHPDLTPEEVSKMIDYILSVGNTSYDATRLPLSGTVVPASDSGMGQYVLMASYTDKGGNGIQPLTVRTIQTFKPAILTPRGYDRTEVGRWMTVPEDAPGGMGGLEIYLGTHGARVTYEAIDLTDVSFIKGSFAVAPSFTTGGTVSLYANEDQLLGVFEVDQGIAEFGLKEAYIPIPEGAGVLDLTMVFENEEQKDIVCIGLSYELLHQSQSPES